MHHQPFIPRHSFPLTLDDNSTLIYTLYTLLLVILILIALPFWLWRYVKTDKYRGTILQRLGLKAPRFYPIRPLWVHAVSVGEVMAARGLVQQLVAQFPHHRVILSTVTKTGQQVARQTLPCVQDTFYLPLDLPWIMHRVAKQRRPRCLIVMETELWPGLFRAMEREQIPVIVVNGRLSPGSFRNYRKIYPLMKRFLAPVHLFAMQSEADAQRMMAIGGRPERVLMTGNIKYDQAMQQPTVPEMAELAQRLPHPNACVWMAASTHPGEEEIILSCFMRLQKTHPRLRLILAPRHPERSTEVETLIQRHAGTYSLFSQAAKHPHPHKIWEKTILLVDEVGWLTRLYYYAHIAFVGGSLIPHGGQNMLEPAAWSLPILFGPHTFNFKDVTTQLLEAQAAIQIQRPEELFPAMQTLLPDLERQKAMGTRAKAVISRNIGALERTTQAIYDLLEQEQPNKVTQARNGDKGRDSRT